MDNYDKLKKFIVYYTSLTSKVRKEPTEDFPIVTNTFHEELMPDYLALYSERRNYFKTRKTAICFYQYDNVFDGHNGLWNSIYYGLDKNLEKFKTRFEGIKLAIEPDFSQVRDLELIENKYRVFKARVVDLFFIHEVGAWIIPNITYADEYSFEYMLKGIETCEVVAFSLKGITRKANELELMKKAAKITVDTLPLKGIVVYSVSRNDDQVLDIFDYAIKKGVKIFIPDNLLKERNSE